MNVGFPNCFYKLSHVIFFLTIVIIFINFSYTGEIKTNFDNSTFSFNEHDHGEQTNYFHPEENHFRLEQLNDTDGPEFVWVKHTPQTPVDGDIIKISTKVVDVSGIENVTLIVKINGNENVTYLMKETDESIYEIQLEGLAQGSIVEYSVQAIDASFAKNVNIFGSRNASFAVIGIINPLTLADYPIIAIAQSMIYVVIFFSIIFVVFTFIQAIYTSLFFRKYKPSLEDENYLRDKRIVIYMNFLSLMRKIPYVIAFSAFLAFILLLIFILTDQMNIIYIEENSSKNTFWFFKLGVFYVNEEGSLLFWGSGLTLSVLITSRTYFKTENTSFEETRKSIDTYWLMLVLSTISILVFWLALLYDSPFAINNSLNESLGRGLGPVYQNFWVVIHAWCIFVSFIFLFRPTLKATISGNLFHPEDSMITELRIGWGLLTVGMITGMAWAYDTPRLPTMWHWDPVLIIVFIIWLSVTGLLHINIFVQKNSQKLAIQVLGISIPILMIVGTIIDRTRFFLLRHSHGSSDAPVWQLTDFYFLIFVLFGLVGLLLILFLSIKIILSGLKAIFQPFIDFIKNIVIKFGSNIKNKFESKEKAQKVELDEKQKETDISKVQVKETLKKPITIEKENYFSLLLKKLTLYRIGRFILWTWGFGMIWLLINLINLNPNAFSGPSLEATEFFYIRMLYWALFWMSFFFIYLWRYQMRTKILSYRMIFWGWIVALIILFPLIQILDEFMLRGPISLSESIIEIVLLSFIFSFSIILTQWFYYLKQLLKSLIWVRRSIHIRKQLYKLASHTIHLGMVLIILGGVADSSWVGMQNVEIAKSESLVLNNLEINFKNVEISNNIVKLDLNIFPFMEWLTIGESVFFQLRISRFISWDVILEGKIIENIDNESLKISPTQQSISSISEAWSINLLQINGNFSEKIDLDNSTFDLSINHRPFLPQFWIGAIFMTLGGLVIVANPKRTKKEPRKMIKKPGEFQSDE